MDLRSLNLSPELQAEAAHVLNYQPFVLSDDLQTGVAYSILYSGDAKRSPPLVFRRHAWTPEQWDQITRANEDLRRMYDGFVEEIARRFPGGSLFDFACNNGYFPVAAERAGLRNCAGMDVGPQYADSIHFLNKVLRTSVTFFHGMYSPEQRCANLSARPKFDVVCASAIMCHLPDPLTLLSYLASLAREAVLFWGQVIGTEQFIISYNPPHPALSEERRFPYWFNDNTRISLGLFRHAMAALGFAEMIELPGTEWIAAREVKHATLDEELVSGSRHRALLFVR